MQFLTEWIMQIITFIFIGVIAQMIIPTNAYKKYVQMIIGLLMLFILIKPIMFFLQMDMTRELEQINHSLFGNIESSTNSFENIALEDERDAYIWNEVKNSMMQEANEQLSETDLEVMDMSFLFDETSDEINLISVQLRKENEPTSEQIEPVTIYIHKDEQKPLVENSQQIKTKLADIWQMDQGLIQIDWLD
ncbi:MAG TPA: stage III sporulation protein AF [Pseudogracilibacillus sp.]|nr:stage III sporulation protein AF [Pseudogracilibacillus sp.]